MENCPRDVGAQSNGHLQDNTDYVIEICWLT